MGKLYLALDIAGCKNNCFHCWCDGGVREYNLLNKDEILEIAREFKKQFKKDIILMPGLEQTYHDNFIEIIKVLENQGFIKDNNKKLLVTNSWGINYKEGLVEEIKQHYSKIKVTLFGIEETHDRHVGRKGDYKEIVEATKKCLKEYLEVIWQIMITSKNYNEIDDLVEFGEDIGVNELFVTGEYYFTGNTLDNYQEFIPHVEHVKDVSQEIYEAENSVYKSEKEFVAEIINEDHNYNSEIRKVNLDSFYINHKLEVYSMANVEQEFLFGNLHDDTINSIYKKINNKDKWPWGLKVKSNLSLNNLAENYGNKDSTELHTPQSLFDKWSWKAIQKI